MGFNFFAKETRCGDNIVYIWKSFIGGDLFVL